MSHVTTYLKFWSCDEISISYLGGCLDFSLGDISQAYLSLFLIFLSIKVCSNDDLELLARGSKKSEKLRDTLFSGSNIAKENEAVLKAKAHKDKLINFDRTRYLNLLLGCVHALYLIVPLRLIVWRGLKL